MSELFERYPASAEYIRTIARKSNISATNASKLQDRFAKSHQDAIAEVGGDLRQPTGQAFDPATVSANEVTRGAIWAACQLERFADAIDVYNETSKEPRSISKLNAAYDELEGEAKLRGFRSFNQEKARLDADLDDAAVEVKRNLDREPKDSEILEAWKSGNLPPAAAKAWAHLDLELTDLPADLSDTALTAEGMDALTNDRLADALSDPNLNLEVRQAILESSPGAVAILGKRWKLKPDMATRDSLACRPGGSGMIVGPDGHLYEVSIPGEEQPLYPNPENDFIPDDNGLSPWKTVESREGHLTQGDEIDWPMRLAFVAAAYGGGGKTFGDWRSIGSSQNEYVVTENGKVGLATGNESGDQSPRPIMGPIPTTMDDTDSRVKGVERLNNHNSAAYLAIVGFEGLSNSEQAEHNRHYATEVTFQETEDGDRRAVINIYQVQSNGEEVRIQQAYGTVDPETGDIVPQRSPDE